MSSHKRKNPEITLDEVKDRVRRAKELTECASAKDEVFEKFCVAAVPFFCDYYIDEERDFVKTRIVEAIEGGFDSAEISFEKNEWYFEIDDRWQMLEGSTTAVALICHEFAVRIEKELRSARFNASHKQSMNGPVVRVEGLKSIK